MSTLFIQEGRFVQRWGWSIDGDGCAVQTEHFPLLLYDLLLFCRDEIAVLRQIRTPTFEDNLSHREVQSMPFGMPFDSKSAAG